MTTARHRLTALDLFSGAGGTGWGLKQAGFTIVGAIDTDKHAAQTYEENLGVAVTVNDIRNVRPSQLRKKMGLRSGELDLLAGCPPCQGFTRLRNDAGADDARNSLILPYLTFVKEFRPKYALFENVVGLARSAHGKEHLEALLTGLRRLKYRTRMEIVESADYGVPQFRQRVILLASRKGYRLRMPRETHRDPLVANKRDQSWITVRETISRFPYLAAGGKNERRGRHPNHEAARTGKHVLKFLRRVPRNGGSRRDVPRMYWLTCHKAHDGHGDTYGRLSWDSPAGTITTGCTNPSKGRYVHPSQTRAISFREAAALQSFPDDFVFKGNRIDRQIGNAVPPRLAYLLANKIRAEIRRVRKRRSQTRRN